MADQMSIREIIETIESLAVDDTITVVDEHGDTYDGTVVETQRREQERRWLIKCDERNDDHILHIYYDVEGGPATATMSFENRTEYQLKSVSK